MKNAANIVVYFINLTVRLAVSFECVCCIYFYDSPHKLCRAIRDYFVYLSHVTLV